MNYPRLTALLALALCCTANAEMTFSLTGVDKQEAENVMAYLTAGAYQLSTDASPARKQRLGLRIEKDIRAALEPFGYYSPVISSEYKPDGENWRVAVSVNPGEATLWHKLDIQVLGVGSQEKEFHDILAEPYMQTGQRALHKQYEMTKTRLRRAAAELGYLDAEFEYSEILVDPGNHSADVKLILQTAARFLFGPLVIEQDVIKDELLARYVNIQEGDPFSTARLLIAKQTLYATDFFGTVDLQADREDAVDGVVPVYITAEQGKRHRYGLGVGYGTDTGYRVSGSWTLRRLNRAGHSLAVDARYSPIKWNFNSAYIIPIGNPALERLVLSAGTVDEELGDANSHRLYGSGAVVRVPGDWQRKTALIYIDETSTLGADTRHDQYWVPSLGMMRKWSETKTGPLGGFQLLGEVQGSGTAVGLETSYVQATLLAKTVIPISTRGRLLLRGQVGTTWVDNFDLLPASRRFFTGGDDSIRGYAYNSISPPSPDGLALGGKHLLVGSAEYAHTVTGPWGVAVFSDTGNAFNSAADSLETSVGIGLRWSSPVGMIRIDVAKSISDSDRAPRLHISVGSDL
ncbi:MAG: autotransporter assembly complex protein TamA [Gammaproteobacteria bacterium]|nr:autotransporter assembly complex protein TamA [Gammaproteobacteria bacterium]